MKRAICIFVIVFVVSAGGFAYALPENVRIVNTSAIGDKTMIGTQGLVKLSRMSIAENPRIFPTIKDLTATREGETMSLLGSIAPEEKLEFISLKYAKYPGGFDIAVVSPDGAVTRIDEEVVIDYVARTIKTQKPITIGGGDIVIIFVKDVEEIPLSDSKDVLYYGGDGDKDNTGHPSSGGRMTGGDSVSGPHR
jgi:hypothetical protein